MRYFPNIPLPHEGAGSPLSLASLKAEATPAEVSDFAPLLQPALAWPAKSAPVYHDNTVRKETHKHTSNWLLQNARPRGRNLLLYITVVPNGSRLGRRVVVHRANLVSRLRRSCVCSKVSEKKRVRCAATNEDSLFVSSLRDSTILLPTQVSCMHTEVQSALESGTNR